MEKFLDALAYDMEVSSLKPVNCLLPEGEILSRLSGTFIFCGKTVVAAQVCDRTGKSFTRLLEVDAFFESLKPLSHDTFNLVGATAVAYNDRLFLMGSPSGKPELLCLLELSGTVSSLITLPVTAKTPYYAVTDGVDGVVWIATVTADEGLCLQELDLESGLVRSHVIADRSKLPAMLQEMLSDSMLEFGVSYIRPLSEDSFGCLLFCNKRDLSVPGAAMWLEIGLGEALVCRRCVSLFNSNVLAVDGGDNTKSLLDNHLFTSGFNIILDGSLQLLAVNGSGHVFKINMFVD